MSLLNLRARIPIKIAEIETKPGSWPSIPADQPTTLVHHTIQNIVKRSGIIEIDLWPKKLKAIVG